MRSVARVSPTGNKKVLEHFFNGGGPKPKGKICDSKSELFYSSNV